MKNVGAFPAIFAGAIVGLAVSSVYAAVTPSGGSRTPMNIKPGKPQTQGYYAFALPKRGSVSKK